MFDASDRTALATIAAFALVGVLLLLCGSLALGISIRVLRIVGGV